MNWDLRAAYTAELTAAVIASASGNSALAFGHLSRAHILSQRHTWQHVQVHILILKLGASIGDWSEVLGQLSRIVAAAIFSRIWVPVGNTGRAGVSAIKPMVVPEDLRVLVDRRGV
jgi:Protein of unknown function (DUF3703)